MYTGTIVHPKATIFAIAGPIVIGSGCIIEEGAIVVNRFVQCGYIVPNLRRNALSRRKEVMRIGDDNLFEIGCRTFPYPSQSSARLTFQFLLPIAQALSPQQ